MDIEKAFDSIPRRREIFSTNGCYKVTMMEKSKNEQIRKKLHTEAIE